MPIFWPHIISELGGVVHHFIAVEARKHESEKNKYFFAKIGFPLNTTPIRKYKLNFIISSTLITMKSLVTLLGFLVTSRPNHVQNSNEFHRTTVLYHFPLTPLFEDPPF